MELAGFHGRSLLHSVLDIAARIRKHRSAMAFTWPELTTRQRLDDLRSRTASFDSCARE